MIYISLNTNLNFNTISIFYKLVFETLELKKNNGQHIFKAKSSINDTVSFIILLIYSVGFFDGELG